MNELLLVKLAWKIVVVEKSLSVEILRSKYLKKGTIMECQLKKGDSFIWHGVFNVRERIQNLFCFQVVDGNDIRIWDDP